MKGARVGVLTAIAGLGLLSLAACSESPTAQVRLPPQQQQEELPVGPKANLVAADNLALNSKVVTNQEGMTLYRFDKDTAQPSVSNCNEACAKQWPPLLVEGKELTFSGIDQSMIGTVKRKDGTKQVTINKWPVYLFSRDSNPGDATGQGMGGTWFAITPDGKKAQGLITGGTGGTDAVPQQQKPAQQQPVQQPPADSGSDSDSGY
jgi:predicted lipoprotein with Yx(FWY)xxD motif